MKRRDYLKTVSSTAVLPFLAGQATEAAPTPEIEIDWATPLGDSAQVLEVETTYPVDTVELSRYEFGSWSTMPRYERVDDSTYEFQFENPTSVVGLHSVSAHRSGKKVSETLLDLDADLLTRHIQVGSRNTARVAVRQLGSAPVAVYNGAVVTATGQQPDSDDVADWQNQRFISLLPQHTSYVQAHVTTEAEQAMQAHQTVWVWLKSETGAWYPATVDFDEYDPVELYNTHGIRRY